MPVRRSVLFTLAFAACSLDPERPPGPNPPGHPLAYVSTGLAGADDIFLLSADGSSDEDVTLFTAHDSWPSWSPNGTRFAFESSRDDAGSTEIYALTVAGRVVVRLTDDTGFADAQPAWSPLNDRIAFVSNRDSAGYDIYLMRTDGSDVTRLTTNASNEVQPAWSPDGSKLLFATDRDGASGEIYVMDSTGGNVVNLTNNPASDLTPAWSPDGSKIAFMSNRDTVGFAIWVMDANGSNPVKVSPSDPPCELPSWTPDGLRLAFDCDADIWVANADGSGLVRITRTSNQFRAEGMPRWKPVP
jgi:Tol biopolymer transport system component